MPGAHQQSLIDAIITLAHEIGQRCPECGEQAKHIAALAGEIGPATPDRGAIQDALDAELSDQDLSDVHVRQTTEAVVRAVRKEG